MSRASSEIAGIEIVRSAAPAPIDFDRGSLDALAVAVEGAQQSGLVARRIRLDFLERVLDHEEQAFQRAVVTPEPHRPPGGIERARLIGKVQRHGWSSRFATLRARYQSHRLARQPLEIVDGVVSHSPDPAPAAPRRRAYRIAPGDNGRSRTEGGCRAHRSAAR